jgi:hypothetical protein
MEKTRPPDVKVGRWEIWNGGDAPPDVRGGMRTGSSYRWARHGPAGAWFRSSLSLREVVAALSRLEGWEAMGADDDVAAWEAGKGPCPDCLTEAFEHPHDCPRGRGLRIAEGRP